MLPHHHRSSPLPSCLRRPSAAAATTPNLTTCIYTTDVGLFALSWCRSRFGRSLHLQHHHHDFFHLNINSFPFLNNKHGSRKINLIAIDKQATIHWDFSAARYGSGPEPVSGFRITVLIDGEIILSIGDSVKQQRTHSNSNSISKSAESVTDSQSPMVLRREHVYGARPYSTKALIGGKEREISIECKLVKDPLLYVTIDDKRVLQIKHLKWKFRGSESVEIDGNHVQISWDVYNWLFDRNRGEDGYALFMFTVFTEREEICNNKNSHSQNLKNLSMPQIQNSFGLGFEEKKKKKKKKGGLLRRGGRSSSFSSFSSANSSSSCSSSVMEWADNEDDEFMDYPYSGFSLQVYAWRTYLIN